MKLTSEQTQKQHEYYLKNKDKFKDKARKWKLANPDKVKASCKLAMKKYRDGSTRDIFKDRELRSKYKLSMAEYKKLYNKQNGACAICLVPLVLIGKISGKQTANVDHCHTTHKIRGLLCNQCNQALGLFKDNATTLRLAAEYIDDALN